MPTITEDKWLAVLATTLDCLWWCDNGKVFQVNGVAWRDFCETLIFIICHTDVRAWVLRDNHWHFSWHSVFNTKMCSPLFPMLTVKIPIVQDNGHSLFFLCLHLSYFPSPYAAKAWQRNLIGNVRMTSLALLSQFVMDCKSKCALHRPGILSEGQVEKHSWGRIS